jgi:phage head maturation protease
MIRFTPSSFTVEAAKGTAPKRTIYGLAAPYNKAARTSTGQEVLFLPGSLPVDGPAPKLMQYHDSTKPIGIVTERVETPEGVMFAARISATAAGDDALTLAQDGVLDSVSVGATPTEWTMVDGVMHVTASYWSELSMVSEGAFADAKIHQIAAQSDIGLPETEPDAEEIENEETTETQEELTVSENQAPVVEASTPTAPLWATAKPQFKLPAPSEYIAAMAQGGSVFAEMNARIHAAAPNITTADTPGILPEVITGGVFDSLNPIRPFVSAIGTKAMPTAGATFRRPKIVTRPVVTEQPTGQLNALDPSTVSVSNSDVSKLTFGTYVTVSEQDLDWSDPASINIILEQLAIAYGQATDNYAVDQLVAQTTQTETLAAFDGKDIVEAIYGAAFQISNTSNYLPTHYFVSPVTWAKLGMAVDNQDRPVFPFVGAPGLGGYNAAGTQSATSWNGNPLGLSLVVDKNMAGGTTTGTLSGVVGHAAGAAAGFEFYEQMKGAISVDVPSTLGRTIAFRGYAAVFMADATKFVKIVNA